MFLRKTIYALLTPPSLFFIVLLFVVIAYKSILSRKILIAVLIAFTLLSMPWFADQMHRNIEAYPSLSVADLASTPAQAVVVLSGGIQGYSDEYQREMPSASSIIRAIYGAKLQRELQLPLLVSGGGRREGGSQEAIIIQNFVQLDLNTPVHWLETQSQTTQENAKYTKEFLANFSISKIILVTSASHMRRAVKMFESQGLEVYPAPTFASKSNYYFSVLDHWVPTANAFHRSCIALHEIAGLHWFYIKQAWSAWKRSGSVIYSSDD